MGIRECSTRMIEAEVLEARGRAASAGVAEGKLELSRGMVGDGERDGGKEGNKRSVQDLVMRGGDGAHVRPANGRGDWRAGDVPGFGHGGRG